MSDLDRDLENALMRYEQERAANSFHRAFRQRLYAMKLHKATRLHYDLRLEWNNVLLSWAIRQGPSRVPNIFRKAIEMDDHRKEYIWFEGLHETGPIILWDRGTWELHPVCDDVANCLRSGLLLFILHGEKLNGGWMLKRTDDVNPRMHPVWTLSKLADSFARTSADECILKELPNSVNGGTMEEVVDRWIHPRNRYERQGKLFEN